MLCAFSLVLLWALRSRRSSSQLPACAVLLVGRLRVSTAGEEIVRRGLIAASDVIRWSSCPCSPSDRASGEQLSSHTKQKQRCNRHAQHLPSRLFALTFRRPPRRSLPRVRLPAPSVHLRGRHLPSHPFFQKRSVADRRPFMIGASPPSASLWKVRSSLRELSVGLPRFSIGLAFSSNHGRGVLT